MISNEYFTSQWQARKREELGGCDPVLLEKTIHAFALLDLLATRGLEFIFKGGTSLLLRLPQIRRFMKQVFDIGELFDAAGDVAAVRAAYDQVFAAENGYRGGKFTMDKALQDAFDTAYRIAQVGFANAPKDGRDELLEAGRKQIGSHLVGVKFRREEMKIAAAKAALLTSALRTAAPPDFGALRYDASNLANLEKTKFDAAYSAVGKLKAIPEAMWLWTEALRFHGATHEVYRPDPAAPSHKNSP